MERRFCETVELRDNPAGGKMIVGHAAVFYDPLDKGSEFRMGPDAVERVKRGAFSRALLENQDVVGCFNHDPNLLLGRRSSGTLRIVEDQRGLRYEIDLPQSSLGEQIAESLRRNDIPGSSFGFRAKKQSFERLSEYRVRNLEDVDLLDVGPVTFPAYGSSSASLRSIGTDDALKAMDEWEREQRAEAVRVRLRALEVG